ncbi:hypothetical protein R3X27_24710 [Tropicimonas sp. TH_r6]|uniref:hypothetical protein n=1 Tax=Tropicimonas sp. TH_r6 TaxID=3082085 RepID=UPI00295370F0|nr:hypothetical protein [Tropicimonas sp. TH_r6]MDV7145893.1 hypothetical protein [Tropicimonas sp. TH_r6]
MVEGIAELDAHGAMHPMRFHVERYFAHSTKEPVGAQTRPTRLALPHDAPDANVDFTFIPSLRRSTRTEGEPDFEVAEASCRLQKVTVVQLTPDLVASLEVARYEQFNMAPDGINARAEPVQPEGFPLNAPMR